MSEREHFSDDPEGKAKIYEFPEQRQPQYDDLDIESADELSPAEALPNPEEFNNDIDKVSTIYSRWLHPSIAPGKLAEIIAQQKLDRRESSAVEAWNQAIEDLVKHSPLFNDYDQLTADPDEPIVKLEKAIREMLSDKNPVVVNQRLAMLVLTDLRSYAAKAGLSDRTMDVCAKLLSGQSDDQS